MRSMTGFGMGTRALGSGRVVAEIRTVNAKGLDVRLRLPDCLGERTAFAEALLRKTLRRGRVEASVRIEDTSQGAIVMDLERARSALRGFEALCRELGLEEAPSLALLASVPGLFHADETARGEIVGVVREALADALIALDADRDREAHAIRQDLLDRNDRLLAALQGVRELLEGQGDRLRQRLEQRIAAQQTSVEPARLAAEIVLLCERADASEELSRLETHVQHMMSLLRKDTECEGKRLDFLLQEMHREATTLGVKAQDASASRLVVEIKVEIERMREQVHNVE